MKDSCCLTRVPISACRVLNVMISFSTQIPKLLVERQKDISSFAFCAVMQVLQDCLMYRSRTNFEEEIRYQTDSNIDIISSTVEISPHTSDIASSSVTDPKMEVIMCH